MHGFMSKRQKEGFVLHESMCVELFCYVTYHFLQLQLEERAKRHRPWTHTDWLSSHPSKGIRGTDGAVLYPEENEGDLSLQGR